MCTYFLNHVNRHNIKQSWDQWRNSYGNEESDAVNQYIISLFGIFVAGYCFQIPRSKKQTLKAFLCHFNFWYGFGAFTFNLRYFPHRQKKPSWEYVTTLFASFFIRSILQVKHLHFMKPSCLRLYHISSSQKKGQAPPRCSTNRIFYVEE